MKTTNSNPRAEEAPVNWHPAPEAQAQTSSAVQTVPPSAPRLPAQSRPRSALARFVHAVQAAFSGPSRAVPPQITESDFAQAREGYGKWEQHSTSVAQYLRNYPGSSRLRAEIAVSAPHLPTDVSRLIEDYARTPKAQAIRELRELSAPSRFGIQPPWKKRVPYYRLDAPKYTQLDGTSPQLRRGAVVLLFNPYDRFSCMVALPAVIVDINITADQMQIWWCEPHQGFASLISSPRSFLQRGIYTTGELASYSFFQPGGTPIDQLEASGFGTPICWAPASQTPRYGSTQAGTFVRVHEGQVHAFANQEEVVLTGQHVWFNPLFDRYVDLPEDPPAYKVGDTRLPSPGERAMASDTWEPKPDMKSRPPPRSGEGRRQLLDASSHADYGNRFKLPATLLEDPAGKLPTAWRTRIVQGAHGRFQHIVVEGALQPKLAQLCDVPTSTNPSELAAELGSQYTTGMKAVRYAIKLDD